MKCFPKYKLTTMALLCLLTACAGNFTTDSYRTLCASAEVYDTSMKSVADLYARGNVTPEQKDQVMELAVKYRAAYQTAVAALAAYERTGLIREEERARAALSEFGRFYEEFLAAISTINNRQSTMTNDHC